MDFFYFDASALAKRYSPEAGTDAVNRIFDTVPIAQLMCLTIGALEVVSILTRKRNDRRMSAQFANEMLVDLYDEVIYNTEWMLVSADDRIVIDSGAFIVKYSINSVDAIVLMTALEIDADLRTRGDRLILVSSDNRLNRAATTENLEVFNPETDTWKDGDDN